MKRKVVVTGGAGYIGSHTVVELYLSGFEPIIIDNLCNSSLENIEGINKILQSNIKWYNIDCTNLNDFRNVFEKEKNIFGCIHFAAYKSVEESVSFPEKYFANNIGSLKVLIECMSNYKVDNLIFSSSCTVYGSPDELPVNEKTKFKKSESPYGETKQQCEIILNDSNLSSISLRYFNPVGSHSSSLIGDCSGDNASNLVPIVCEVLSGKRDILTINGKDYSTLDGTCVRDYIHVEDLASAHVNALDFLLKNKYKKFVFNVGSGKGNSVLEIVNSFERDLGLKVNYKFGPRRKGDVEAIFASIDLINKKLNWIPKKSIKDAIIDSWNWQNRMK